MKSQPNKHLAPSSWWLATKHNNLRNKTSSWWSKQFHPRNRLSNQSSRQPTSQSASCPHSHSINNTAAKTQPKVACISKNAFKSKSSCTSVPLLFIHWTLNTVPASGLQWFLFLIAVAELTSKCFFPNNEKNKTKQNKPDVLSVSMIRFFNPPVGLLYWSHIDMDGM